MKLSSFPLHQPDCVLELEEEIEAQLVALMDRAREAQWQQEEIADAVMSLARNYCLRLDANHKTDKGIARATRGFRHLH